ncbi:MAG: hypothetical protein H6741_11125 [Alphaproteobacteria bacterium]|nr:hypothetical protein [Alphaproteobacteria bacterium]MCB9793268.1 hypothetical protein [Alphaproteobacteria bacterium]
MTAMIALLLFGCVVRYGPEPEAAAAGVEAQTDAEDRRARQRPDYAALEAELLGLLEQDEDVNADRRDRVHAAQELTLAMRSPRVDPDAAVEAYLRRLIEIEARSLQAEQAPLVGEGVSFVPLIQEEELDDEPLGEGSGAVVDGAVVDGAAVDGAAVDGAAEGEPAVTLARADEAMVQARQALAAQDYPAALQALAPLRGEGAPVELEELYLEAADGWVHQERERAGALFLEARGWPAEKKDAGLREVEAILQGLLDDYPESTYADAIERNLGLVRKELGE